MIIRIVVEDDPLEITLEVEHPLAEECIGRTMEIMKLLEDNMLTHTPVLPPKARNARGFVGSAAQQ